MEGELGRTAGPDDTSGTIVRRMSDAGTSPERERKDLYTGVEELDLEVSFHDWPWLSDQLIQPLFNRYAFAAFVHVAALRGAGQLPVNGDTEANRTAPRC